MSLKETINSTTIADRTILVILLLASLTGIVFIKEVLPEDTDVRVDVGNKIKYRYPLYNDRIIKIDSSINNNNSGNNTGGHITLEIKDGKVRVIHASCANKLCERQGWIKTGAIVCLPNRVSIIVGGYGELKNGKFDAISG